MKYCSSPAIRCSFGLAGVSQVQKHQIFSFDSQHNMHISILLPCALLLASSAIAKKNPKRGLAFAESDNPNDIKKVNTSTSVISWQYDWGTAPPDYLAKSAINYIPMQWGLYEVEAFVAKVKAQKARIVLVCHLLVLLSLLTLTPRTGFQRT